MALVTVGGDGSGPLAPPSHEGSHDPAGAGGGAASVAAAAAVVAAGMAAACGDATGEGVVLLDAATRAVEPAATLAAGVAATLADTSPARPSSVADAADAASPISPAAAPSALAPLPSPPPPAPPEPSVPPAEPSASWREAAGARAGSCASSLRGRLNQLVSHRTASVASCDPRTAPRPTYLPAPFAALMAKAEPLSHAVLVNDVSSSSAAASPSRAPATSFWMRLRCEAKLHSGPSEGSMTSMVRSTRRMNTRILSTVSPIACAVSVDAGGSVSTGSNSCTTQSSANVLMSTCQYSGAVGEISISRMPDANECVARVDDMLHGCRARMASRHSVMVRGSCRYTASSRSALSGGWRDRTSRALSRITVTTLRRPIAKSAMPVILYKLAMRPPMTALPACFAAPRKSRSAMLPTAS
mmetsp:Transcript_24578/g.85441  ORF Transcript_24578/g.85441 Transcript_24578/m.85441 type:complete len:415 (-) Transcript_24578:1641-2885(-)